MKINLREAYQTDPLKSDDALWGRRTPLGRRGFIKNAGLSCLQMAIGAHIVFSDLLPAGLLPVGLLDRKSSDPIPGKNKDMIIINDMPLCAEPPAHLMDPSLTPLDVFFIRNNGIPPERSEISAKNWTLTIDGESAAKPIKYSIQELKARFQEVSIDIVLECAGNGRKEISPSIKGNQWLTGAVGCARFTGVRLKEILKEANIKSDAKYIGYYGADKHLSRDPSKVSISRGIPLHKALEDECIIAWAMNGEDLPLQHGYPLRLIVGGWPASCSGKWLTRIRVRNKIHDGSKMEAPSYMMPCEPVAPGAEVADKDMCIIESMPVKSIITYPQSGAMINQGSTLSIRGHAWAGDNTVSTVEYSIDFGSSWQKAELHKPPNRFAWQRFQATVSLPKKGYYEIWARATDDKGISQPMLVPGWNPKGYLNNACHRIAVKVV